MYNLMTKIAITFF